ncbi:MAG: SiaB family protein kinase [Flavobacteriales bacterium]
MQSRALTDFTNRMKEGEVIFSFNGEITEEVVGSTLKQIEVHLESNESDFKKGRKVYNVMVEALQNLYHHVEKAGNEEVVPGENQKKATFIISKIDDEYNILAANYVAKSNIPTLKARLDKINALDKDGLRDYYKEVLTNGQYSVHGGGGLGMIDIARKSGNALEYDFSDVGNNYGLYVLRIKV